MALVTGLWTATWKCWSNPSSGKPVAQNVQKRLCVSTHLITSEFNDRDLLLLNNPAAAVGFKVRVRFFRMQLDPGQLEVGAKHGHVARPPSWPRPCWVWLHPDHHVSLKTIIRPVDFRHLWAFMALTAFGQSGHFRPLWTLHVYPSELFDVKFSKTILRIKGLEKNILIKAVFQHIKVFQSAYHTGASTIKQNG